MAELGDEALPEEHRAGRTDRAHEIDRNRQRRVHRLHQEVRQPVALIVDAVDHAFVPGALRRLVEPALARRAEQRLTGDAGMDRQRIAGIVEDRAKSGARVRPVDIMLHVLFTRARELDRTPDCLRHLHRLQHVIRYDLAAEAAAEKVTLIFTSSTAQPTACATASWHAVTDWMDPQISTVPLAVALTGSSGACAMCGSTKRRSMIEAARSCRIRVGSPLTSAVTARSASRPAASMASILALERSPALPPSNSTSSTSSARLACQKRSATTHTALWRGECGRRGCWEP